MKSRFLIFAIFLFGLSAFAGASAHDFAKTEKSRKLYLADYREKVEAAWLGQIIGAAWGMPLEFRFNNKMVPDEAFPAYTPERINKAFNTSNLYIEMAFLNTLERHGLDVDRRQAGIDFANTEFTVWCANAQCRKNLRAGLAPPDSGHPANTKLASAIDYQIESDYAGLISPGLPNRVIAFGETFGRMMCYGDGFYAGLFIGGIYAESFFTRDIHQLIDAGLRCIPEKSRYAEMVRDVLAWSRENRDWRVTWQKCTAKYLVDPENNHLPKDPLDVKINGAYVLIGLLYGNGDFESSVQHTMRCGADADSNASTVAGLMGAILGKQAIAKKFNLDGLDRTQKFSRTSYNFSSLLAVCEKLARANVVKGGGKILCDQNAREYFDIPVTRDIQVPAFESTWAPGPLVESHFTPEEMAKISPLHGGQSVFFLGDAITRLGWDQEGGFIRLCEKGLNEILDRKIKIQVFGLTGCKSSQMLVRLERDVLTHNPTYLVLSCGVNDVKQTEQGTGVSLTDYKSNMSEIITRAQARGIRVIVLTTTLLGEDETTTGNQTLSDYNKYLRFLAHEKKCVLVDVNRAMTDYIAGKRQSTGSTENFLTTDGIRLSSRGHHLVAKEILLTGFALPPADCEKIARAFNKQLKADEPSDDEDDAPSKKEISK